MYTDCKDCLHLKQKQLFFQTLTKQAKSKKKKTCKIVLTVPWYTSYSFCYINPSLESGVKWSHLLSQAMDVCMDDGNREKDYVNDFKLFKKC